MTTSTDQRGDLASEIITLYHWTTSEGAEAILTEGFRYQRDDGGFSAGWLRYDENGNEVPGPNPDPEHYPNCADPIHFTVDEDDARLCAHLGEKWWEKYDRPPVMVLLMVEVPVEVTRYDYNLSGWTEDGSYEDWENHPWRVVSAADLAGCEVREVGRENWDDDDDVRDADGEVVTLDAAAHRAIADRLLSE